MTPAERLQAEKERILAETGCYVPPFRLANLMKAAGRIIDILIKADIHISYEECRLVLRIVEAAIISVTKEKNEHDA